MNDFAELDSFFDLASISKFEMWFAHVFGAMIFPVREYSAEKMTQNWQLDNQKYLKYLL